MTRRPRLLHRERAEGVDKRLLEFLNFWAAAGPFPIMVMPSGGVRYNEALQLELFRRGVSKAKTLAESAHGRAGAVDVGPVVLGASGQVIALLDNDVESFRQIGELAKSRGLVWGGDWKFHDAFHLEVPDWKRLPFPPAQLKPTKPKGR